jgi:hypothetical protein
LRPGQRWSRLAQRTSTILALEAELQARLP